MDLKEIRTLIDLMKKNGLTVFKMEREGFKITMKTASPDSPTHVLAVAPAVPAAAASAQAHAASESACRSPSCTRRSNRPWSAPFTRPPPRSRRPTSTVGQEVTPETVVCIIEAMKVMNEIKAEVSGVDRGGRGGKRQAGPVRPGALPGQ